MGQLKIILIDVGWGDSIFLEATDKNNDEHYALIDSNDSTNYKSSLIFLRRYFQKKFKTSTFKKPLFDWIMLTHAHMDHGQGLKEIMRTFQTKNFYYPKSLNNSSLAHLQNYANRAQINHQAIDDNRIFPDLGDAKVKVLWPEYSGSISDNENNNSIVLTLTQDDKSCVLTGDAEEEIWNNIQHKIPANTVFFKVPHHGSRNGSLNSLGIGTWTNHCPTSAILGLSTHNRPFNHPHQVVLNEFTSKNFEYIRTDVNYHIEVILDNTEPVQCKYSR